MAGRLATRGALPSTTPPGLLLPSPNAPVVPLLSTAAPLEGPVLAAPSDEVEGEGETDRAGESGRSRFFPVRLPCFARRTDEEPVVRIAYVKGLPAAALCPHLSLEASRPAAFGQELLLLGRTQGLGLDRAYHSSSKR